MEGFHSERLPESRDKLGRSFSDSPREREVGQFKATPTGNRAPASLLPALNSMLRTTTETGDIGQFSIKPPRLPQRLNSPRMAGGSHPGSTYSRSQHELALINRPLIDDRKCLPSYARDATSEVVSMYETASQKSTGNHRFLEDPDYRSYSMTQASYTSYTLSNHRSYASLRSQPELSLVQRPRSPFPYPARLKRPGFQPSSPVLANREADYNRIIEVERTPNVGIVEPMDEGIPLNRSSPSSLYVQRKALPPVALGRSTAPQHSSFVSRQPNSEKVIGAADTFYDWRSRPELLPRNTSPARSTFSLASTVNLYQPPLPVSATIAQRKLHTQAPLYYDYTEDFDIEEEYCNRADVENPPLPPLLIDRVIHEHKNLSPEHPLVDSLPIRPAGVSVNLRSQDSRSGTEMGSRKSTKIIESMIHPMNQSSESEAVLESQPYCEALNDLTGGQGATSGTFVQGNRSQSPSKGKLTNGHSIKSPISGSELNSGIRQTPMLPGDQEKPIQKETMGIDIINTMPNRNPSYELLTHLSVFPSPPDQPVSIFPENLSTARNQHGLDIGSGLEKPGWANYTGIITETERPLTLHVRRHSQAAPSNSELDASRTILRRSASARDGRSRHSRFYSIDCGLADLAQLITRFEAVNKSLSLVSDDSPANILTQPFLPHGVPRDNLALNNKKDPRTISLLESQIPLNNFLSGGDSKSLREGASGCQDQILPEDLIGFNKDKCEGIEIPNFSHRIPRKPLSRSASPILVPEPVVSTARILKLKQSVPQLMKALPPIPLESIGSAQQAALDPFKSFPMRQESEPKLKSNTVSIPVPAEHDSTVTCSTSMRDATLQAINIKTASARPSKFKLKPRLPFSHQPYPISNIRPWSPDENRPSTNRQPDGRSPITMSRSYAAEATAKFKLKATKTSNPIEGTVRVNREARSHKVVNNLDLRHPRDLFTSPGFNGMFQQAGRHFSTRKMSQSYEPSLPPNDAHSLNSVVVQGQQDSCLEPLLDLGLPLSDTTYPISSTEVRSFFSDDSSQVQGHNSLRKRISNLRARIPVPYTSRPAVQSSDVVWRERTTVPDVKRFKSSLSASQDNSMITEADVRPRRLRSKVSGWFKDARNVVTGCVRQRNNEELKSYHDSQVVMR